MKSWKVFGALAACVAVGGCDEKALVTTSAKVTAKTQGELNAPVSLHLRLVNAKSGKPMGKQNLNLSWDDSFTRLRFLFQRRALQMSRYQAE